MTGHVIGGCHDGPVTSRRVAAFDFDGTLTRRDTLIPFLAGACGRRAVADAVAHVTPVAARARAGRLADHPHPRDAAKEALLAPLLGGRSAAWLAQVGADFARPLTARRRPDMVDQQRWHQDQGHEVVIVSASLLAYLEPFAADLGIDHVIAVGFDEDADGRLTGRLTGPNVRGPEKAVRLRAWLGPDAPACLWAYGNSSGDTELLAMADVAVWVDGHHHIPRA